MKEGDVSLMDDEGDMHAQVGQESRTAAHHQVKYHHHGPQESSISSSKTPPESDQPWSGFHRLSRSERQERLLLHLHHQGSLPSPSSFPPPCPLSESMADQMVENGYGILALPLGLGVHFLINGQPRCIPMAVEEPSVIAAACHAAKTIAHGGQGGFQARTIHTLPSDVLIPGPLSHNINWCTGQIMLSNVPHPLFIHATETIHAEIDTLLRLGNQTCPGMVKRGGGVKGIRVKSFPPPPLAIDTPESAIVVVDVFVDVCDAMGANTCIAVAEALAPTLQRLLGVDHSIAIMSNYSIYRFYSSTFRIPFSALSYKGISGDDLARRIVLAHQWAKIDMDRAVTNNKGIMNGIDAVAVALGQDWRAIEASCHAWAAQKAKTDKLRTVIAPLAEYSIEEDGEGARYLCGSLSLPLQLGVKGGVHKCSLVYESNYAILGSPTVAELGEILVSVGLAQNFAALRALVTEGILRGHMQLHARNKELSKSSAL